MEKSNEKIDKLVKEESKKPRGRLYCPRCGSSNLFYYLGSYVGQIYECKECGYRGSFVIEDSSIGVEIRKKWIKERRQKNER